MRRPPVVVPPRWIAARALLALAKALRNVRQVRGADIYDRPRGALSYEDRQRIDALADQVEELARQWWPTPEGT